jgi:hypothetical protein
MNEPLHVSPPVPAGVGEWAAGSFDDLVDAEKAGLFGALCLITRDRYEAEDVMQEAFLKVWERWDRVGVMDDPTGRHHEELPTPSATPSAGAMMFAANRSKVRARRPRGGSNRP